MLMIYISCEFKHSVRLPAITIHEFTVNMIVDNQGHREQGGV